MKHKYISTQSNEILVYFNDRGQSSFTIIEARDALPQSNNRTTNELLGDMVRRGLLMRLKKGVYYIIPYEQNSDIYMPDWHLLASPLTDGAPHYIGYYSALQIHNLITQPSLKEQIVVARQIKPSVLTIKDVDFQFIYHNKTHFFGAQKIWIDNFSRVLCSDLEKTIIDCLFRPDLAGGIVEVARAIYVSKDKINFDKLLAYTIRFGSQAVIKRLGFLLELFDIQSPIIEELNQLRSTAYTILDTELPKEGKMLNRWRIQQNIDTQTIKSAILT